MCVLKLASSFIEQAYGKLSIKAVCTVQLRAQALVFCLQVFELCLKGITLGTQGGIILSGGDWSQVNVSFAGFQPFPGNIRPKLTEAAGKSS